MKTVQIKIGKKQLNFNTIHEASEYLVTIQNLQTKKSNRELTLEAINQLKNDPKSGVTMSRNELKAFLFND
ncbi:hypothetical protein FACS1894166_00590 [Bacilli bacterium]|nr:hypothetical protein FACS1894166_00590 [Bacilli bacterium]